MYWDSIKDIRFIPLDNKGLEIALGEPRYVVSIDPEENRVTLGTKEDLRRRTMVVREPSLMKYTELPEELEVVTKIRYKNKGALSRIRPMDDGRVEVEFYEDVEGIAPGQSAVFYEGEDVVGGGFID